MLSAVVRALDVLHLVQLQRTMRFRLDTKCGRNLKASSRSNLFIHGAPKSNIVIGPNARFDGTLEVYSQGRITIGRNFFLGRSRIYCSKEVLIGDYVLVSDQVSIMDSDLHPMRAASRRAIADGWSDGTFPDVYSEIEDAPVSIGDDVWIGFGASVLKGVSIGRGAIIGAGTLVTRDVPPWTIVAGNPARVIRELTIDER